MEAENQSSVNGSDVEEHITPLSSPATDSRSPVGDVLRDVIIIYEAPEGGFNEFVRLQYSAVHNLTASDIIAAYRLYLMTNPTLQFSPLHELVIEEAVETNVLNDSPEAAPIAEDMEQIAPLDQPPPILVPEPNQNVDGDAPGAPEDVLNYEDDTREHPIFGYRLLLSPEDTEAVFTLITLAQNNRQPPAGTFQAAEQNAPEYQTLREDQTSSYTSQSASLPQLRTWIPEGSEQDEDFAGATSSEKPTKFDCNQCGKYYATSSNLSRHKQTHRSLNSELAQRCRDCNKVYVSMSALAMHTLTHRMRHSCGECGKQFSRPWLLRGHLRSHTGEKPYKCIVCGKSFADRSNLRAHLQTHSPDKKFECMRCNKTFALKTYLNKHQESACARLSNN